MLAGLVGRRDVEILAHRHVAEFARHLEGAHHAGARAFRRAGRRRGCARPVGYGPTVGVRKPEITLNSVDLPAPFGPIRPVIPSSGTRSVDILQDLHAAEGRRNVADLEGHRRVKSPSRPCGR